MPQPLLESKKERNDMSNTKAPNKDMTQKTTIKKKYKIFSNKSIFFYLRQATACHLPLFRI